MPKVSFLPENVTVEVTAGTTILEAAARAHVPEGSACGGVCACSTCHVYVVQGFDTLEEAQDAELDILDKAFDVRANSRLGCQTKVTQDIVVELSNESRETWYNEHPGTHADADPVIGKKHAAGGRR